MKLLTRLSILAALTFALVPGAASAVHVTLTFDTGYEDPTIVQPSGYEHGPYDWIESGARIAGFWAEDVGTPQGHYLQGHLHPQAAQKLGDMGIKEAPHTWTDDLQGIEISLENGGTFDLVSVRYRVGELNRTFNPAELRLPWTWAVEDPQILAAESFDPTVVDFSSEWTPFAAVTPHKTWHTMNFSGFDNVTSVMLTQTAYTIWFDNIVINVHDTTPIPEPGTGLLMGLGLLGLAARRSA